MRKLASVVLTLIIVLVTVAAFDNTQAAYADGSGFGSCPHPGGSISASFTNGSHWIAGNRQLQWGSDTVFSNGNNNFTQCFCPLTANNVPTGDFGIQTKWLHAAGMTSQQKQWYLQNGWIDIPDGSVFGLTSGEFLAQNSNFSCGVQSSGIRSNIRVFQNNNANISNSVSNNINVGNNVSHMNTGGSTFIHTGNAVNNTTISNNANTNVLHVMQQQANSVQAQIVGNGAFSTNRVGF